VRPTGNEIDRRRGWIGLARFLTSAYGGRNSETYRAPIAHNPHVLNNCSISIVSWRPRDFEPKAYEALMKSSCRVGHMCQIARRLWGRVNSVRRF
jgi:hypothetical protein